MNKIRFDAKVLDLYNYDYEYLQDTLEHEVSKALNAYLTSPGSKGILRGFDLSASTINPSKIKISHNSGIGYIVTSSGAVLESSEIFDLIDPSDDTSGVINYIYIKPSIILGSYNKLTKVFEAGVKRAIDHYDYTLQYDREEDSLSIVVYTAAEYALLSAAEKSVLIGIGNIKANGPGNPLTDVSNSTREILGTHITDGTVTLAALSPTFMLPQTMVDPSVTVDDSFTGTSINAEDNFNELRREVRLIKGTGTWTDPVDANLLSFDFSMNKLHFNGVFPYLDDLEVIPTSSGTFVQIQHGKAAVNGRVVVLKDSVINLAVPPADRRYVGNYPARTGGEAHACGAQPDSFYLAHTGIGNLYVVDSTTPSRTYILGADYTLDNSTGLITTIVGGDIVSETVDCYYEWGYERYDSIEVTSTGTFIYQIGTASSDASPYSIPGKEMMRLYTLHRPSLKDYVDSADLLDSRTYVADVPELRGFSPNHYALNSWAAHEFTFLRSDGLVDDTWAQWTLAATSTGYSATTSTINSKIRTTIYTNTDDELWLRVDRGVANGPIEVKYESIPGSNVLDKTITLNLYNRFSSSNCVVFIAKGFSRGYHNIQITCGGNIFIIHQMLVGKNGAYYFEDAITIGNMYANNIHTHQLFADIFSTSILAADAALLTWKTSTGYIPEVIVEYDGDIYKSRNTHTSSPVPASFYNDAHNWEEVGTSKRQKVVLDNKILELSEQLETERAFNFEQEIRLDYLENKQFSNSFIFSELFWNKDQVDITERIETHNSKPAEFMCDNDFYNNWKEGGSMLDFKNGFMRPKKQAFMLEVTDEYGLAGVGQTYKGAMKYDSTNECYWMISHAGAAAIGEITQLHKSMEDGKVQVLGRWYIPAGAATTYWSGIASDGSYLYVVLSGADAASKFGKLAINKTGTTFNGTLGKLNKKNGETLVNDNTCFEYTFVANAGTGWWNDVISWDTADIGIILCNAATAVTIPFFAKSNGGAGTATTITGLQNYVGGGDSIGRQIDYNGTTLWVRVNNITTADLRLIYKIVVAVDIVSSVVIKTSGRFGTTRDVDREAVPSEGICIGHHGDILEITSTLSNGKFISRRSLKNSLWAENQIIGEMAQYSSTAVTTPKACMIEDTSNVTYYWTADWTVTANQVDIFRFCPSTGAYKHARLTNQSWTAVIDLTYNPNTDVMYIIGWDGTNWEVFYGDLSDFVALMGTSYNVANTITIGTAWGTISSGIGAANTNALTGICYDPEADLITILNDTDDKLDTLSLNGATWTQGVYDLPTPTNEWRGLAYKNSQFFINDLTNVATPARTFVLKKSLCTATAWWRSHIYQDPSILFTTSNAGRQCIDFCGNDLVSINYTALTFVTEKVLEDPDVMQLHTFMDANNILLSSNVSCTTAVAERYFNPEDFVDPRDCPDLNYWCVGYGNEGFTECHGDEYLYGKSSTGKDRYDVSKIRTRHYKRGANNIIAASAVMTAILIEKDMIIIGCAGTNMAEGIVDLKAGTYTALWNATYSGFKYNGTLSERNDAKTLVGVLNSELTMSGDTWYKIHARTFFKEDKSDYNGAYPKTFISIGNGGGNDVLIIDWDDNGNRTPVKVWNNVWNNTALGQYASWISPNGTMFQGAWSSGSCIYYGLLPIWQLAGDTTAGYDYGNATLSKQVGVNILAAYSVDISPNSRCWKTPSGTWRHQLFIGCYGAAPEIQMVDVENATAEVIAIAGTGSMTCKGIDNFEDMLFCITGDLSASGYLYGVHFFKKLRFDDKDLIEDGSGLTVSRGWSELGKNICSFRHHRQRPYFNPSVIGVNGDGIFSHQIKYSKDFGIAGTTGLRGLQFFHFPQINNCTHQSTTISITNPTYYHFSQGALLKGASFQEDPI